MLSPSASMEARIHGVSARTPSCFSGSSGGAKSWEWLPRITRVSVDPDRAADKMNTGARSIRLPRGGVMCRTRRAGGRDS